LSSSDWRLTSIPGKSSSPIACHDRHRQDHAPRTQKAGAGKSGRRSAAGLTRRLTFLFSRGDI
jgi:hypothetical protein